MNKISYIEALRREFITLKQEISHFLNICNIREFRNDPNSGVFIVTHQFHWASQKGNNSFLASQHKVLNGFKHWEAKYRSIFLNATKDTQRGIEKPLRQINDWIEQTGPAPSATSYAKQQLDSEISSQIDHYLATFEMFEKDFFVYPDTNVLLRINDYSHLKKIVDGDNFSIVFLSTVLSELDRLKNEAKNNEVREKAQRAVKMIKGLRLQGDLLSGVSVANSLNAKVISVEPKVNILPWLDKENNDDRIIASILNEVSRSPGSIHLLITEDINLQNKAATASLSFIDFERD